MAGRPRKDEKTKTKGRKGTGTVTIKTQKIDRKPPISYLKPT